MSRYGLVLILLAAAAANAWADEPKAATTKPGDSGKVQPPAPAEDKPADRVVKDDAKAGAADKDADKVKVTVESVSGRAQKLPAGKDKKWLPLKKGDVLDEMTIVRTGLGAKVTLKFADRGEVQLTGACKMGVREFRKKGEHVKMRLGLKYGTLRASIEKPRGSNDWKVATPVATLAVPGSRSRFALLLDNPSPLKIQVVWGQWNMRSGKALRSARAGEGTDNKGTRNYRKIAKQRDVSMGDDSGGLTPLEQENLDENGDGRGIFSYTGSRTGFALKRKVQTCPEPEPSPDPPPEYE